MKFAIHRTIYILFSFLFIAGPRAQVNENSSSTTKLQKKKINKKNPAITAWSREIDDVDYSAVQYHHAARLRFGNWKFKAVYPSPLKILDKPGVINYRKNTPVGVLSTGNTVLLTYDTIHAEGKSPGKIPFFIHFVYMAEIFEKDESVGLTMLLKKDHTYDFGFYNNKKIDGFVSDVSGEKFPFHLILYYDDSVAQPLSYIQTGPDSIIMKPVFNNKIITSKRFRVSGSSYEGINYYLKGNAVAGAIWYQGITRKYYKFWYDPSLDRKHQEAIASMLFIMVGFIN